ncbi:MAG: PEP-CTERM sorting domain-containing protein [Puniceicoccaceae bacterium]
MSTYTFIGVEDFEEGIDLGGSTVLASPLQQGVPNTASFPNGILQPITISRPGSLNFGGATSDPWGLGTSIVITGGMPIEYSFSEDDKIGGVGFNLYQFSTPGTASVSVYDTLGALIGSTTMSGDSTGSNYLGIMTDGTSLIGSIQIGQTFTNSNNGGADNIALYAVPVPEPSTYAAISLCVLGMLLLLKRRLAEKTQ